MQPGVKREESYPDDGFGPNRTAVESFIDLVRGLTDENRLAVAEARKAVSEPFHAKAWRAAGEALAGRGEAYLWARRQVARAHIPERLAPEGDDALGGDEAARWSEVARLVQQAIDDALMAFLTSDIVHPKHLRELHRSWRALDR